MSSNINGLAGAPGIWHATLRRRQGPTGMKGDGLEVTGTGYTHLPAQPLQPPSDNPKPVLLPAA